ncbi:MAG: hypothetical protein MR979_02640, partial [Mollicutes bacterium]|nr:hypothetical protein [Mollicutes bacterium]
MSKIIKLVMADETVLEDKEAAMKIIQVTSERQVAYYLSTLLFFKYMTHRKKFTDQAKEIRMNEADVKRDIYNKLKSNEIFNKYYTEFSNSKEIKTEDIVNSLSKDSANKCLSESTKKRRASTIKSWVEWMYKYDSETNQDTAVSQKDYQLK